MAGTQKAVLVKELGKPVELGSRNIPSPKEGEVLVKVTAAMILPHDAYGRDWGLFIAAKLPASLSHNVAGVVDKIGSGVTSFEVGDRVFGLSAVQVPHSDQNGLQEYAILNTDALARTPKGFSDEQVATLPVNLVTSWIALFNEPGFNFPPPFAAKGDSSHLADTTLVVIGGGTNAGKLAVQLAHLAGIGKIVAVAGSSNKGQLTSMGATHVVDRSIPLADVTKEIQAITGTDGAQYVYNTASRHLDLAIAALSPSKQSKLRSILPIQGEEAEKLKSQRPLCDAGYFHCTNENMAPCIEEFWAHVPKWLEEGKVLPTEYRVVEGLDKVGDINEVLDMYLGGARAVAQTVVKI